jgi:hypothetical protein
VSGRIFQKAKSFHKVLMNAARHGYCPVSRRIFQIKNRCSGICVSSCGNFKFYCELVLIEMVPEIRRELNPVEMMR